MTKAAFSIRPITKKEARSVLEAYHYLTKEQRGFKSGYNYGLIKDSKVVGVCIFTVIPVKELVKTLGETSQDGLYELSRLCIHPDLQGVEHNITSWFLARCIKHVRRATTVKLILSYADTRFHEGTVYKATNFQYLGKTIQKKDFWQRLGDGSFQKVSRGKVKHLEGEWRDRSIKHKFILRF